MEKGIVIQDDTPEQESPYKNENDLEAEEEYYKKFGVVKPPAPPPSFIPKSSQSQSTVQQLSARLKTTQAAGSASAVPLKVSEKPLKALVALVVQMEFGSADKAESLITELLGMAYVCCLRSK